MTLFGKHPKTPDSTSTSQPQHPAATTTSNAPTSKTEEEVGSLPAAIALPEPENGKNEDLDMATQLDGAFKAIGNADQDLQKYKDSKSLKVVNAAGKPSLSPGERRNSRCSATGTAINTAQTDATTAQGYASTAKTVYDSDAMKTVREGVNMLVESLPGLVKALDEVAKLHPFIASKFFLSYFNISY